jgi:hypothetical protein
MFLNFVFFTIGKKPRYEAAYGGLGAPSGKFMRFIRGAEGRTFYPGCLFYNRSNFTFLILPRIGQRGQNIN